MTAAGAAACGAGLLPLSATASAPASGSRSGGGSSVVTSGASSVVVTGGLAPYTHSWTLVSASNGFAISSATSASPTWSKTMSGDSDVTETWHDTVTDALGQTAVTNDVTPELISSSGS